MHAPRARSALPKGWMCVVIRRHEMQLRGRAAACVDRKRPQNRMGDMACLQKEDACKLTLDPPGDSQVSPIHITREP